MTDRASQVRFYVDADIRGLGLILGGLRNDLTYPADPGGVIHKRKRSACPIASTDVLDEDWIPVVAARGWLIITRDSKIIENRNEINAIRESGAKMVALNQQDALAQTEALLAVAAAIDRLAEALSGRGEPRLSPVRGQADHVAEVRRQHPNAYMPWTAEADAALLAAHQAGHDGTTLADTFGRQPSAIRSRLNHLGANAPTAQATDTGAAPDASPSHDGQPER